MMNKKKPEKTTELLTVRLTPSTMAKLKELAEEERRPTSNMAMVIIEDYIEANS